MYPDETQYVVASSQDEDVGKVGLGRICQGGSPAAGGSSLPSPEGTCYSFCLSRQGEQFPEPMADLTTCTHVLNVTGGPRNDLPLSIPQADVWWGRGKKEP